MLMETFGVFVASGAGSLIAPAEATSVSALAAVDKGDCESGGLIQMRARPALRKRTIAVAQRWRIVWSESGRVKARPTCVPKAARRACSAAARAAARLRSMA